MVRRVQAERPIVAEFINAAAVGGFLETGRLPQGTFRGVIFQKTFWGF
jgi:hypothetical protein